MAAPTTSGAPGSKLTTDRKIINAQGRKIIYYVYNFMKNDNPNMSEKALQKKVSVACGISYSSVFRIVREGINMQGELSFSTPRKKRPRRKTKSNLDTFDKCILRSVIYDFYVEEGIRPTLKSILEVLKGRIHFKGGIWCLRQIIIDLGFRWEKLESNGKFLIEKSEIRYMRINYLRNINRFRNEGRPIVYIQCTFFHRLIGKLWLDETKECLKKPVNKEPRVIALHAGGEDGFIKNGVTMFKSCTKTSDCESYEKWILEKLIPNLKENSVVVIDNSLFHSKKISAAPSPLSKKAEMLSWLMKNEIPFSENMLKPELYRLIQFNKPRYKMYEIDSAFTEHGHSVLRLPSNHPDLNPMALIWATVKEYIEAKIATFSIDKALQLAEEKLSSIDDQEWKNRCYHIKEIEYKYLNCERIMDDVTDQIIINLEVNDNSSSEEISDIYSISTSSESEISEFEEIQC